MEFRLSAEQELFKRMIREYCEENVEPRSREIDDKEAGIPDEIIQGLADLGVFGITIPEKYGGSAPEGEEMTYASIAVHEIARAEMSMALPVYTLLCLGWGFLITKYGTDRLKEEVLARIAAGKYFAGINTTEPAGGSDIANIQTSGVYQDGKFIVNGEKAYISGVLEATEQREGGHITLIRTDPEAGHRGFTFIFIPANLPGISYSVYEDIGRMGLSTGGFVYKDVEVPEYYVLGEVNRGFYLNMEGFNLARILVSAACVGMAEKALEISRDYVTQRVLFGRPIAKFEGISFEIAEDHARLEQLKLYLQYTAWAADTCYQEPGFITQRELSRIVSICKVTAPKLAAEIAQRCMTHLGAFGYTKDCPLGRGLRGVMSYVVGAEGGYHIQKLIIAREFIGDVAVPYR
ncbi:MAG: acyl-CoA dehydrogenase family protein [Anaerolineae bacterium]